MSIRITAPFDRQALSRLRAGDSVLLSGTVLTGRDAAHKRLCALLDEGRPLPISLQDQAIYYVGPCPPLPGDVIGSCGPTTSGRMDAYAPRLMDLGLARDDRQGLSQAVGRRVDPAKRRGILRGHGRRGRADRPLRQGSSRAGV